jgi:formylmethanofuran dehydrogenase subunit E
MGGTKMDLTQAKLGDQFRIFVDAGGNISSYPQMTTILATVIATKRVQYGTNVMLGWKANEPHPPEATARANTSEENNYLPNQSEYKFGKTVKRDLPVAVQIFNGLDGFPCKKCTNFYPQALANQKDGTLICWSCRSSH